ncbi:glutathione S-transferase [Chitinimonas sp. BJB300]|uniref:glutathione S-transferase n=1 Tax=Chitinimonas sp. BJB300 TaxID=1559339 RepID=UPI000C0D6A86|nr:glutathione S-transferase [Chitinimonas sp. BJB300]PHV09926.1 glutathione S-transferase [Chitinimonas sp. BJB300]TSJ89668.1 glutathione S-transferase [Chitinimonas sp. BJB300]
MKLIASLTSPYARKVRIVLQEKRIECPLAVDIPWNADSKVVDVNPLGKVPVLVLDDGSTLFDSRVIVEYLDHVSPVAKLIPNDYRHAIQVKRWEALADGICDAAAIIFLERKRMPEQQSQDWIKRQEAKITRGLQSLAEDLGENSWCNGESYSLADIAVGACLGYLDFRFAEITWRSSYPNLARLADKLAQRPAFADTVPQA